MSLASLPNNSLLGEWPYIKLRSLLVPLVLLTSLLSSWHLEAPDKCSRYRLVFCFPFLECKLQVNKRFALFYFVTLRTVLGRYRCSANACGKTESSLSLFAPQRNDPCLLHSSVLDSLHSHLLQAQPLFSVMNCSLPASFLAFPSPFILFNQPTKELRLFRGCRFS